MSLKGQLDYYEIKIECFILLIKWLNWISYKKEEKKLKQKLNIL